MGTLYVHPVYMGKSLIIFQTYLHTLASEEINRSGWTHTANDTQNFLLFSHSSIHHVINHNPPSTGLRQPGKNSGFFKIFRHRILHHFQALNRVRFKPHFYRCALQSCIPERSGI